MLAEEQSITYERKTGELYKIIQIVFRNRLRALQRDLDCGWQWYFIDFLQLNMSWIDFGNKRVTF
jgi:hypothetical protein